MKPLSIAWVILVGLAYALLNSPSFLTHTRTGGIPMIVTPDPAIILAIAITLLIWSGLAVCCLRANKDTWIDAIGVIRITAFARTGAAVGPALTGILIGVMIVSLTQLKTPTVVVDTITSGPSDFVGLIWIVVVLVVERQCVINPDDDGSSGSHEHSVVA